jgi:hypothetical protein
VISIASGIISGGVDWTVVWHDGSSNKIDTTLINEYKALIINSFLLLI